MNKLLYIFLFLIFFSCDPGNQDSIIFDTIPLTLSEFLNEEEIILINTGTIENNYFLKNLIEIKGDSLLSNPNLNNNLVTQLIDSNDSTYIVNIQGLGKVGNMDFSHDESEIDSLIASNQAVYELGYSRAFREDNQVLYYLELIDIYHRLAGKGVIVQLSNRSDNCQVDAVVDGWKMRNDTVSFFGTLD